MKKAAILLTLVLAASFSIAGESVHRHSGKNIIGITPPHANCFSYDYIDLNYIFQDFENRRVEGGDAWGINFSKSLGNTFYLTGSYENADYEGDLHYYNQFSGISTDRTRLGLGVHRTLFNCVDLTFEGGASYQETKYEVCPINNHEAWGWYVGPGIRAKVGKNVEFYGNAFYSGEEGDYGWRFTPGFILNVTEMVGLKFGGEFESDVNSLLLGVRVNY